LLAIVILSLKSESNSPSCCQRKSRTADQDVP
jgi:hypothetical protein